MYIRVEVVNGEDKVVERFDLPEGYRHATPYMIMLMVRTMIKQLFL
jgi:hypothetical protein